MTAEHMDQSMVEEFRQRLGEARRRLLRTVITTDEELATLERHQAGGPGEDVPMELATAILSRLEGQERHELDEVEAAQTRLEAGHFGMCEGCRGRIPLARLRAMPTARYCLACQARREPAGR